MFFLRKGNYFRKQELILLLNLKGMGLIRTAIFKNELTQEKANIKY
jgi:hypothetical protein